jgi:hypothetical protein
MRLAMPKVIGYGRFSHICPQNNPQLVCVLRILFFSNELGSFGKVKSTCRRKANDL